MHSHNLESGGSSGDAAVADWAQYACLPSDDSFPDHITAPPVLRLARAASPGIKRPSGSCVWRLSEDSSPYGVCPGRSRCSAGYARRRP